MKINNYSRKSFKIPLVEPSVLEKEQLNTSPQFPDISVGKESTCNAGDPCSTPGSGRSAEEGIGYPLQYS